MLGKRYFSTNIMRFQSSLSVHSFYKKMEEFVLIRDTSENIWYLNLFRKGNKKYTGYLDKEKKQFQLEPKVILSRAPFVKINGKVEKKDKVLLVDVSFKIPLVIYLTTALVTMAFFIWLGMDYLIKSVESENSIFEKYPIIIVSPVVIYVILYLLYLSQKNIFLKRFKNFFDLNKNTYLKP